MHGMNAGITGSQMFVTLKCLAAMHWLMSLKKKGPSWGYASGSKGYKPFNPETEQMSISCHVIFLETSVENALQINKVSPEEL